MGTSCKPNLWKKVTKKFKKKHAEKNLVITDDRDELIEGKTLNQEIKDKKKKDKRKKVLKNLGKRTLMVCRYMGMGAALASPAHFTMYPSPYYPGNEDNYYRPEYNCYF